MAPLDARTFAREWLWFVGSLLVVLALTVLALGRESLSFGEFWIAVIGLYAVGAGSRLTIWAVKTLGVTSRSLAVVVGKVLLVGLVVGAVIVAIVLALKGDDWLLRGVSPIAVIAVLWYWRASRR